MYSLTAEIGEIRRPRRIRFRTGIEGVSPTDIFTQSSIMEWNLQRNGAIGAWSRALEALFNDGAHRIFVRMERHAHPKFQLRAFKFVIKCDGSEEGEEYITDRTLSMTQEQIGGFSNMASFYLYDVMPYLRSGIVSDTFYESMRDASKEFGSDIGTQADELDIGGKKGKIVVYCKYIKAYEQLVLEDRDVDPQRYRFHPQAQVEARLLLELRRYIEGRAGANMPSIREYISRLFPQAPSEWLWSIVERPARTARLTHDTGVVDEIMQFLRWM